MLFNYPTPLSLSLRVRRGMLCNGCAIFTKAKRELDSSEGKVLWRGRRTGLLIDGTQVAKDADGFDNIASFFDSARIGMNTCPPVLDCLSFG